jgi:hypothetical protein
VVRRVSLIAALTLVVALAATATAIAGGFLPVKGNPADKLVTLPIDDYGYDYAKDCRKKPTPGAEALVAWLTQNAGGQFWGIMRCERWGKGRASLHAEGRAIDWHLDVHNAADKAEATRLIKLLLAPDSAGNLHALARRMGIQEIIWNCQSWYSGSDALRPYSPCFDKDGKRQKIDDTTAHRNHIHIGLNWLGAKKRTTFWSQGK